MKRIKEIISDCTYSLRWWVVCLLVIFLWSVWKGLKFFGVIKNDI
jgi:hypothetical protein